MQPSLPQPASTEQPFNFDEQSLQTTASFAEFDPSSSVTAENQLTLNPLQMGQGASSPRDVLRDPNNSDQPSNATNASPTQNDGGEGDNENGAEDEIASRLRRTRRFRNRIERMARLSQSRRSSSCNDNSPGTDRGSRIPSLRWRTRNNPLVRSRSPSPLNVSPRSEAFNQRRRTMPPMSSPLPPDLRDLGDPRSEMMEISPVSTVVPNQTPAEASTNGVRRSRMSRFRTSISSWPDLMPAGLESIISRPASRRPSVSHRAGEAYPSQSSSQMDIDTATTTNSNTPQTEPSLTSSATTTPPPTRPDRPPFFVPGLSDHMDNPARVRPGEDQAAMLSRLLSVAAAATAASLVGNADQAITEAQDVGGDNGGDGSFESFLRALQNGRLEAALRNGGNEMGGGAPSDPTTDNGMLSLNFFRMFRFGSTPLNSNSSGGNDGGEGGRMVPVIIVGIRSVTPQGSTDGEGVARPTPFFDALANLPVPVPGMPRRSRHTPHRRAASMGSSSMSDSLNRTAQGSASASPISSSAPMADTPPGPHPPPSTPADPGSSTFPRVPLTSQSNRRSMVESEMAHENDDDGNPSVRRESLRRRLPRRLSNPVPASSSTGLPRTGPSNQESGTSSGAGTTGSRPPTNVEGTRSWIIYVLGGSYPENHPILTTPSLFTDEPTYEDMTLLSSILGPAKPPVASSEDIQSAGGVFAFGTPNAPADYHPSDDERCLICLCEYETDDECRQLTKCRHVFHKDCIDTWLTTGRNSCPLCRGEGVKEKSPVPGTTAETSTSAPTVTDQTTAAAS